MNDIPKIFMLETNLRDRIDELEEALREIIKGEGAFSRDPFTHAANCIDNMKRIAIDALTKAKENPL